MHSFVFALAVLLVPKAVLGQVTGSAPGFAAGTTGGGVIDPVTPSTTDELIGYLTDDEPRVILVTKTFDFIGTEGKTTEPGCRPTSNTCGSSGQDALDKANWCGNNPKVPVTYDNAAVSPIYVKSNKSLVGVGDAGVLKGKGLYLKNVENIIIQNIHITELNPQYIWGGDAIQLVGTDKIWIDHNKFSLIGRMMIVTGYDAAGHVTISNNEFDGVTPWSATCNGKHYWTIMFLGAADHITLSGNYVHDVSGRAPKVGPAGTIVMHAVNNYFENVDGHDFDVHEGGTVLIEGNVFKSVKYPITEATASTAARIFNVPSGSESSCSSSLGRACVANEVSSDSGPFADYSNTAAISAVAEGGHIVNATAASSVASCVVGTAGIGKLSSKKGRTGTSASTRSGALTATTSV